MMSEIIQSKIFLELLALSAFVLYIYFSYCDGFGLNPFRKLMWGVCFVWLSYKSFVAQGHFDLKIIILLMSLFAFILAWIQRRENLRKK